MSGNPRANRPSAEFQGPIKIFLTKEQVAAGVPLLEFIWEWTPTPGGVPGGDNPRIYGVRWLTNPASVSQLMFAKGDWPLNEFAVVRNFVGHSNEGPFIAGETSFTADAIQTLADGATVTPEIAKGNLWVLTANGSRTIAAPSLVSPNDVIAFPRIVTLRIKNNTAGAITTTFNAIYHVAWVEPGAGQSRTITMYFDGTDFWQVGTGVTVT